jgi:hypothetical protein
MFSIPLGQVYPADFAFCGYPITWVRSFNAFEQNGIITGEWVTAEGIQNSFSFGDGFVIRLTEDGGIDDDSEKGLKLLNNILELPYFQHHATCAAEYDKYKNANMAHDYDSGTGESTFYYFNNTSGVYKRFEKPTGLDPFYDPYVVLRKDSAYMLAGNEFTSKPVNFINRFALIGNPYMADFDFDGFYTANNTSAILPVYNVWIDNGLRDGNGTYITYNAVSKLGSASQYIAPLQGFIVQSLSETTELFSLPLAFNETTMTKMGETTTLRSSVNNENKLDIVATNPVMSVQTVIAKRENGQDMFNILDAQKLMNEISEVPEIYTLKPSKDGPIGTAINVINKDDLLIPLALATSYSGDITLTFSGMDTYNAQISLLDLGAKQEISLTDLASYEYTFNYSSKKDVNGETVVCKDRFYLRISKSVTGLTEITAEKVNVYETNGSIQVVSGASNPIKEVAVYNLQGVLMHKTTAINAISHTINLNWTAGVYIVKVISEKSSDTVKIVTSNK